MSAKESSSKKAINPDEIKKDDDPKPPMGKPRKREQAVEFLRRHQKRFQVSPHSKQYVSFSLFPLTPYYYGLESRFWTRLVSFFSFYKILIKFRYRFKRPKDKSKVKLSENKTHRPLRSLF